MNWLDYLEEEVKDGLKLCKFRQKRGYNLFWTGKNKHDENGMYEVRQGVSGFGGDVKQFRIFRDAYDWLWNGTSQKRRIK